MKTKLEIFTILLKITINWDIYIHFVKVFYTKVSRIRRLTLIALKKFNPMYFCLYITSYFNILVYTYQSIKEI